MRGSALALSLLLAPHLNAQTFVFEHANVIDGVSSEPLRNVTVVVRDGRIDSVGSAPRIIAEGAKRIDLAGKWLLPGFVDAHVHTSTLEGGWAMLRAGVTTGRSMLTSHYADAGLRELHRRGDADVPEILAAGYPIVPIPQQFRPDISDLFLENPQLDDLRKNADIGVDGVRRVVQANLDHHVDLIKVFATDRALVPTSDPRKPMLSEADLAAAVQVAHKAGVPVAAHAHGDGGAAAAVRAGVDTIEHGTYLSDDTLRLMKERNVCLTPTLATLAMETIPSSPSAEAAAAAIRTRAMLPRARETVRHARRLGVRVIAGTDTGYEADDPHLIADEMAELVGIGMSPMEAIQAATSRSAECVGIAKRTGSIRSGFEADLIVIDQNPLADINATRDVLFVLNDGKVAIDHLSF